jgi:hypothetical protein
MNVGRMIAYWEARVARGEAVRVSFGGGRDYKLTEKGSEVDRLEREELERSGHWKKVDLQYVTDLANESPAEAARIRRHYLRERFFPLDEQPEIPGFPLETAESLAHPPVPEKPPSKRAQRRAARDAQLAAQIIVGR